MDRHVVKLYIPGQRTDSKYAVETLRRICEQELHGEYKLMVVDLTKNQSWPTGVTPSHTHPVQGI